MHLSTLALLGFLSLAHCTGPGLQIGPAISIPSDQRLLLTTQNGCTTKQITDIQAAADLVVQYAQAGLHAIDCWDAQRYPHEQDIFGQFFRRKIHSATVKKGMELVLDRFGKKEGATKLPVFCMPESFAQCKSGLETFPAREVVGNQDVELAKAYTNSSFLYVLGLCPKVWQGLAQQPQQCKPTTAREPLAKKLFHDVMEVVSEFQVGDLAPGLKASQDLVKSDRPDRALRNADSYAYFASMAWLGGWNKSDGVEQCVKGWSATSTQ